MIGNKLFATGLFVFLAAPVIISIPAASVVGAVLMGIGVVLLWLDK